MTRALKGLNKRTTDTAAGECYLTPRWAVRWLLERLPPVDGVICDPCAGGFAGWSIGLEVGKAVHHGPELPPFRRNPPQRRMSKCPFAGNLDTSVRCIVKRDGLELDDAGGPLHMTTMVIWPSPCQPGKPS